MADCVAPSANCNFEVHAAIGELSEEHRVVVSLRHFSGLSTGEIARVLAIEPGTVRSRLARAYARLRELLGSELER